MLVPVKPWVVSLLFLCSVVGLTAQTPPDLVGCYRVQMGSGVTEYMADHIPNTIELRGELAGDFLEGRGEMSQVLSRMGRLEGSYGLAPFVRLERWERPSESRSGAVPSHSDVFPVLSWWTPEAGSVRLVWTDGFSGVEVTATMEGEILVGLAKTFFDHPVDSIPDPVDFRAEKVSCPSDLWQSKGSS